MVQDFVHELKVGSRAKEVGACICELGSTPSGCKRGLFLLGFFRSLKNMSGHNKMHPLFLHSHVGLLQLQAIVESFCKACCNYWMLFICFLFHGFYQFKLTKTK